MKEKEKKEAISIRLIDIKETAFKFNADYDCSEITDKNLGFGIGQKFHADLNNDTLTIGVSINYRKLPEEIELAELSILLNYKIPELGKMAKSLEDGVQINNKHLMLNLLSVSYGTLRGVLYTRLKGTPLEKFPLPLISANDLANFGKEDANI